MLANIDIGKISASVIHPKYCTLLYLFGGMIAPQSGARNKIKFNSYVDLGNDSKKNLMPTKCHQVFLAFEKRTTFRERPACFLSPSPLLARCCR